MQKKNGLLIFSPTDLTRFMESPFASWMDRFAIEQPDQCPEKDPQDALSSVLANMGYDHENAQEQKFITEGLSFIKIEGASDTEKSEKSIKAMHQAVDIIAQARLELGQFAGYADFLVKVNHSENCQPSLLGDYHYEVWDTKLASKVKPTFIVQLCCYSEMLKAIQGVMPHKMVVFLGNQEREEFKTLDFHYKYQSLKKSFLTSQQQFDATSMPDPADSKSWAHWSNYAEQLLVEKDHLFQIAGITQSQIKKLNRGGILTMQQLVDTDEEERIKKLNPASFKKLKSQASIQKQSIDCIIPKFEIIAPEVGKKMGLALLPPHSPYDVFFDIEGFPLEKDGLEYLWGCAYFNEAGTRDFKDFWAHNQAQEKEAFEGFIRWAFNRWKKDPTMHIYHYASYEITACRKLMGRYGVCENEVDQLLRNDVFVDLYKIVKGGLLLGEPRYSLKNVEHLYRDKRNTEVGSGGDSMVVYEQWRELHIAGKEGNTWQTSKTLKDIRDYNIDDCNSTQELTDWLRVEQNKKGIGFLGRTEVIEVEPNEEIIEQTYLRDALLEKAADEREINPEQAALTENMAWVLEFHRREAKSVFWRMFERRELDPIDLLDDLDCLAGCERTDQTAFKPAPGSRNLAYEYRFEPSQEFKGTAKTFYLLGVETDNGRQAKVSFLKEHSDLQNGLIVLQSKTEPPHQISLIPDEYVNPAPIPQAIRHIVGLYAAGQLLTGQSAIIDFLTRSKPRIKGHTGGPIATNPDSKKRMQEIIQAIKNLDSSYLTIQGPPGSGKSFTGKQVIAELVKSGKKVGIASNSHKAINHLVLNTAKFCKANNIEATFCCTSDTDAELKTHKVAILKNEDLADHVKPSCVIGTTAWGFSRDDMENQLDYLFVDEAGQVSIANLIAMSSSATNLVLMGDQMQLGQPSQGSHPAESGLSVLDYLLHETPTISDDMGVFLNTTYRMHSSINQFISTHIYDGKLESNPDNDQRVIDVPSDYHGPLNQKAGIVFVPVEHEGNIQASVEEVAKIKELATALIGRTFHTGKNQPKTRPIGWSDMMFVAPYNHQVSKLQKALGLEAKVGSVDKFQGQEAPIVFLSMCSSDASESARGLDFLFDKQRLNVAISRAQTLAVVVGNPKIGETPVNRVDQLKLVNFFNALTNLSPLY